MYGNNKIPIEPIHSTQKCANYQRKWQKYWIDILKEKKHMAINMEVRLVLYNRALETFPTYKFSPSFPSERNSLCQPFNFPSVSVTAKIKIIVSHADSFLMINNPKPLLKRDPHSIVSSPLFRHFHLLKQTLALSKNKISRNLLESNGLT